MGDTIYIVQGDSDNFENIRNLLNIFTDIIEVDEESFSLKTTAIDSILKQKVADLGASFWQEGEYSISNIA